MLHVLYRIYEVADPETAEKNRKSDIEFGIWSSTSKAENIELLMDCCICETRDQFKQIIRSMYGEDIPFRYSKNLEPGRVYCIIIGEKCYNPENYFDKIEFDCSYCNSHVQTYLNRPIAFSNYEISSDLYNIDKYRKMRFCSHQCKNAFLDEEKAILRPDDDAHFFVDKDGFARIQDESIIGYIYKITKRSTGQFYIGQTKYVPIFRWGEHLHTERFPLSDITDYSFEVIAKVFKGQNILDIEKEYIQSAYVADPEHSLNIACTKGLISE